MTRLTSILLAGAAATAALTGMASAQDKQPVVGIIGANYAIEAARAQYESVAAGLKARGIAFKFLDAQLDINKQVAHIDQFVDEGVAAIAMDIAGDPNAVLGPLTRADAAGVKIFSIGGTPGFDKTLVQVNMPSRELGVKSGEYVCEATGGTGEIALIEAIEIPVLTPRWDGFKDTIKEKCPDLKIVAIERAIPDDAATGRPLAENLLTRFPDLKAIWSMNDGIALGAGLAAKSAGREILITGLNGENQGIDGIRQGVIQASWDMMPTDGGMVLAGRIADILEGKTPAPTTTEVIQISDVATWTRDNVADWKPYDQRVEYPGLQ